MLREASSVISRDSVKLLQYLNGDIHHRIQDSFVVCWIGWHLPTGVSYNQPLCSITGRALDDRGALHYLCHKILWTERFKQQNLFSHSLGGWEVQDHGASQFSSWQRLSS